MYPLQLLTDNVLLATMLGMPATTHQKAAAGRELMPAVSIPSVSETPAPLTSAKWWHHSFDQGVSMPRQEETEELDNTPEEPPHWKWKEGRSVVRPLKEYCQEAFSKESQLIRAARQGYYKTHQPNYECEGSYNLSSTFREMATSANLMGSEVHEVWTSQKDLRATHCMAKTSPKGIHFFRVISPTNPPKIMRIPFPQGPVTVGWVVLLSVVWKRRTEWGYGSKPPMN